MKRMKNTIKQDGKLTTLDSTELAQVHGGDTAVLTISGGPMKKQADTAKSTIQSLRG